MKTYQVEYEENRACLIPTKERPEVILSTDFQTIGIIPTKVDNFGLIEAIEVIGIFTGCVVLEAKRC